MRFAGEANANYNTNLYNCTFPEKINDWRDKWTGGFGPYGFVQLANFVGNGGVTVRCVRFSDKHAGVLTTSQQNTNV